LGTERVGKKNLRGNPLLLKGFAWFLNLGMALALIMSDIKKRFIKRNW
jgi:hypothetical protein